MPGDLISDQTVQKKLDFLGLLGLKCLKIRDFVHFTLFQCLKVRNNDEEVKCKLLHWGLKKTPHPFWQHRENAMHKATERGLLEGGD